MKRESMTRLALLAIILLALGLRVYRLAAQSLWYDEAVTAQVATQGVVELTRWTADDIQPPLYYYVVAGWTRLAGRNEWALRFPSLIFGVLTIPLLWALACRLFGRGRSGRLAGLLAALLAAVSPLYVYYAQEARMYTQLTCLGALAGYCLLRAMSAGDRQTSPTGRRATIWWLAFTLSAAAVLYTHYFGLFLLLAYGLYILLAPTLSPRSESARPALRGPILAALGAALLYLPWLPAMLNRYQVDRSYWQGPLKLGEAVRHVALSITAGSPETLRERYAIPLLPWFGVACGVALLMLVAWPWLARLEADRRAGRAAGLSSGARRPARSLLFLLSTLVVPVMAVLALASRTPKFNARYLMLVSPAYFLVLGGGLGLGLLSPAYPEGEPGTSVSRRGRPVWRWIPAVLSVAALSFVALVSLQGVNRWFTDPTFTKAQWRQLAAAVRQQMGPNEAVLLVSGHSAPAWSYYAPDIPTVDLPDIAILDVNATLGFETGATLNRALAGKSGAWLVQWQSDAVDPLGIVPYALDRAGSEVTVRGHYWQLGLRHWQLPPGAQFPDHPQPQHADAANFGYRIGLLGWDNPQTGTLTVYWQALATLAGSDYQVSLRVEDASGRELQPGWDGRPAAYLYPTDRWQPVRPVFGRYPLPKDLPAGQYYVTLAVYDAANPAGLDVIDVAGNPAGKRVRLGPFALSGD